MLCLNHECIVHLVVKTSSLFDYHLINKLQPKTLTKILNYNIRNVNQA